MLVSFSVSNFRSFGEEQTLSMVASKRLTDHPNHLVRIAECQESLLRTAVIYGANAAGKSNLVKAMEFAQRMIVTDPSKSTRMFAADSFRMNPEIGNRPTSFEFRFWADNRIFTYGFDFKGLKILSEWLSVLVEDDEMLIFERGSDGNAALGNEVGRIWAAEDPMTRTLGLLTSLPLTSHQLLMNRVLALPRSVLGTALEKVAQWLTQDLVILHPDHRTSDILDKLGTDEKFRCLVEEFLGNVGTGVSGVELQEEEIDVDIAARGGTLGGSYLRRWQRDLHDLRPKPDDPTRLIRRRLFAKHPVGNNSAILPFSEESDGTKQLLHLMPVLASTTGGSKVVVIDELDRSLHPLICWQFIRLFSETAPGLAKQLIVTTHEAHLLNQKLLRRDEYWFVEKDDKQQSRLTSLSDFNIRKDLQVEKGYLQGRFGGIPVIGSMDELEKLVHTSLAREADHAP